MNDLYSNIKTSRAISPVVITAGNATLTSEIIDTSGYGSLAFVVITGALTDAVYTCTVYEGDASNMSDEAAVSATLIQGTQGLAIIADATGDNLTFKFGYLGSKRYTRIKIVQSAATTGGYINAVALQGHPKAAPVA